MMLYYQTKFGSKPIFLHALRLMVKHHNTKFGNKMFGTLEDIIWTVTKILNLRHDLDLESCNPIFQQDSPAYDAVLSNQVWLQTDQQFRNI